MKRVLSSTVGLALVAVLSTVFVPTGASAARPASTSSAAPRAVSSACATATAAHRDAVTAQSKATKKAKAAAKALTKFKKAKKKGKKVPAAKIKKATKKAKQAKSKVKKAKNRVAVTAKAKAKACKKPQVNTGQSQALAGVLGLLLGGLGGKDLDLASLTPAQLQGILNLLAPGVSSQLSPAQLALVLETVQGLTSGDMDPAALATQFMSLFGERLDPAVLQLLLGALTSGGTAALDPAQLTSVVTALIGALGDLAPALPTGTPSPEQALGIVATAVDIASNGLLAQLGLGQVGDLLQGLAGGGSQGLSILQLTAIKTVVSGLALSNLLDGKLDLLKGAGVLAAVVGGLTDGAGGLPKLDSLPLLGPILSTVLDSTVCAVLPLPICS